MLICPNRHITELMVCVTNILKYYSAYPRLYNNHNNNKNKNRYKTNKHHISFQFYDESHMYFSSDSNKIKNKEKYNPANVKFL